MDEGKATLRHLPSCGSTNVYLKEHTAEFAPVGAVYTMNQTAGRGRLGRTWENAADQALYYSAVLAGPLAQPETLPQLSSGLLFALSSMLRSGAAGTRFMLFAVLIAEFA